MLIPIGDDLAEIGVIVGSEFDPLGSIEPTATSIGDPPQPIDVDTPYGRAAGPISIATVAGRRVAVLARHGRDHSYAAHRVPDRANLWALASLGVRAIVAQFSVGALQPELAPGDLVVVDQLVDHTWGRADTFHDGGPDDHPGASGGVHHQPFADPYDDALRAVLVAATRSVGGPVHDGGTMVVVNGPRFSTRAEGAWFRSMGWHVVDTAGYPEAVLAAEAGIPYAGLALVTYVAAAQDGGKAGVIGAVAEVVPTTMARVGDVLRAALPDLP